MCEYDLTDVPTTIFIQLNVGKLRLFLKSGALNKHQQESTGTVTRYNYNKQSSLKIKTR